MALVESKKELNPCSREVVPKNTIVVFRFQNESGYRYAQIHFWPFLAQEVINAKVSQFRKNLWSLKFCTFLIKQMATYFAERQEGATVCSRCYEAIVACKLLYNSFVVAVLRYCSLVTMYPVFQSHLLRALFVVLYCSFTGTQPCIVGLKFVNSMYIQVCKFQSVCISLYLQVRTKKSAFTNLCLQVCKNMSVFTNLCLQVCKNKSVFTNLYFSLH